MGRLMHPNVRTGFGPGPIQTPKMNVLPLCHPKTVRKSDQIPWKAALRRNGKVPQKFCLASCSSHQMITLWGP